MPLFNKAKSVLEKLQKHDYKDAQEKQALLDELVLEPPASRELVWMLTEHDSKLRDFATEWVCSDRSQYMLQLLVKEMQAKEAVGRRYIPTVIARVNPTGLFAYLHKCISHADAKERQLALDIISNFPKIDRFLPILQEAIEDPQEEIRYTAITKLCSRIRQRGIFLSLLPALDDESDRIRHKVILEMSNLQAGEIVEPFFARLPNEPREVQNKIIAALSRLAQNPELKIEERVIPVLASDSDMVREAAARLLAQMPNKKETIRTFLIYLRGIAFWLRERIFESIAKIAEHVADAVVALMEEPDISIDCMFLVPYIHDQRLVPGVIKVLTSDADWWIKVSAIDILVKLKPPGISNWLKNLQSDPELKWCIIGAYGELADPANLEFLVDNLQSQSRYIQLESLRAVAKFKNAQVNQILQRLAQESDDWEIRNEAKRLAEERAISTQESAEVALDRKKVIEELKKLGLEMEDDALNLMEPEDAEEKEMKTVADVREQTKERPKTVGFKAMAPEAEVKTIPAMAETKPLKAQTKSFQAIVPSAPRNEAMEYKLYAPSKLAAEEKIPSQPAPVKAGASPASAPPSPPSAVPPIATEETSAEGKKTLSPQEMLKLFQDRLKSGKYKFLDEKTPPENKSDHS